MRYYVNLDFSDRVVFHGLVQRERLAETLERAFVELAALAHDRFVANHGSGRGELPIRLFINEDRSV